jgi:hypothetical protein
MSKNDKNPNPFDVVFNRLNQGIEQLGSLIGSERDHFGIEQNKQTDFPDNWQQKFDTEDNNNIFNKKHNRF